MWGNTKPAFLLLVLLTVSIASTAGHYVDNSVNIDKYPSSDVATAGVVAATWLILTPVGILGYRLYTSGRLFGAYAMLAVFSLVGLSTPGHYTSASLADFALWRNISILLDAITGAAVLAFVLWSALIAREWSRPASNVGHDAAPGAV